MIDVYAFSTPNSVKVPIALEELGLDYALHGVNIRKGGQKTPEFVALNPNAKVPVLVDHEAEDGPLTLTESAAILVYLAEKTAGCCRSPGTAGRGFSSSCSSTPPASASPSATPGTSASSRPNRFRWRSTGTAMRPSASSCCSTRCSPGSRSWPGMR